MRLLNASTLKLKEFYGRIPKYAILSHTWAEEEVSFDDIANLQAASAMQGYRKIWMTCQIASDKGFEYVWIDTCCIDKKSSADLSESINSMYAWYRDSEMCFVYLSDISSHVDVHAPDSAFGRSRWFTRGWTLQELLAPSKVIFYSQDWIELGTKSSLAMEIERITMIDSGALTGEHTFFFKGMDSVSIARKMSWAAHRKTTRPEDIAYCLIGIFNINMPILYGEGKRAFHRLQLEIMKLSHDQTLFAWMKPDRDSMYGCTRRSHKFCNMDERFLAVSPNEFSYYRDFVACYSDDESPPSYSMTNTGIDIRLPLIELGPENDIYLAVLNCGISDRNESPHVPPQSRLGIRVLRKNNESYQRIGTGLVLVPKPGQLQKHRIYLIHGMTCEQHSWSPIPGLPKDNLPLWMGHFEHSKFVRHSSSKQPSRMEQ